MVRTAHSTGKHMTRHLLPRIDWVGTLSPPAIDDARARRAADALRPRRPARRVAAILGLISLTFCLVWLHDPALNGSLPTRAAVARGNQSPPIGSGVHEMRPMRSLMAGVVGAGVVATGAAAQSPAVDGAGSLASRWRSATGSRANRTTLAATSRTPRRTGERLKGTRPEEALKEDGMTMVTPCPFARTA